MLAPDMTMETPRIFKIIKPIEKTSPSPMTPKTKPDKTPAVNSKRRFDSDSG